MITATQAGRASLLLWLKRAVAFAATAYLALALFFGIQIFMKRTAAETAVKQLEDVRLETQKADDEIRRAGPSAAIKIPTDLSAVARLQSSMESRAAAEKCDLVEFRASSDITPFLTRFAKTATVSGWGQVEAQATLNGTPKSVLATIAGLSDGDVPYEFDSIEIKRDKINEVGDALVSAHITMRVLIRTEQRPS